MIGQTNKAILKNELQRNLRHNMTDAERSLWQALRGRQMSGYKFRRQHPFGDFILDFVCLEKMLIIKLRIVNVQRNLQAQVFESCDFGIMKFLVSLKLLKKGFGWSYRKQETPILIPTLSLKEREQKKLKIRIEERAPVYP